MAKKTAVNESDTATTEQTTTAPLVAVEEEPAELAQALALRGAVERFNTGAVTRTAIDSADLDALANLEADFWRAALREFAAVDVAQTQMPAAHELLSGPGGTVAQYIRAHTATVKTKTDTLGEIETPAIDNEGVRRHIFRLGTELLATIDRAIADSRRRVARQRVKDEETERKIQFWVREVPVFRCLLTALNEITTTPGLAEMFGLTSTCLDLMRRLQVHMCNTAGSPAAVAGQLWVHNGIWRTWLPRAVEVLNEKRTA